MPQGRVFIIDDSQVVLDVAQHALKQAGYEVETCDNPLAAAFPLRKFRPDLVLIDFNMPAIKGDVVAGLLASLVEGTPILLHSDIDPGELAQRAKAAGVSGFIRKTFDAGVFVDQVAHWVQKAKAR